MLRIDRSVTPTMAKTPTLAQWELDRLRTIDNVVRLGHLQQRGAGPAGVRRGRGARSREDAVIVHCAAPGLRYPPLVPIWGAEAITLQPIRAGFPCFGAALAGFVEATIDDDDEKNRLCPPSPFSDTPPDWARMQVLGGRASMACPAAPRSRRGPTGWRSTPRASSRSMADDPALAAATDRFKAAVGPALARMAELGGVSD